MLFNVFLFVFCCVPNGIAGCFLQVVFVVFLCSERNSRVVFVLAFGVLCCVPNVITRYFLQFSFVFVCVPNGIARCFLPFVLLYFSLPHGMARAFFYRFFFVFFASARYCRGFLPAFLSSERNCARGEGARAKLRGGWGGGVLPQ